MFHIKARFEDTQITAVSPEGHTFQVEIQDISGLPAAVKRKLIELPADQLSMILQFCLHPDGTPTGYEEYYKVLEPIFAEWPQNLRPIP